jgi:hypothetical protein
MAKPAITKRATKAAALTYAELDTNFQNLADATVSLTAGTGGTAVSADLNGNITLVAGTGISLSGNNTSKEITINSTASSNTFNTIAVAGQSNVVADSTTDTLTLIAGSNITLTTNATNDSITFTAADSGLTSNAITIGIADSALVILTAAGGGGSDKGVQINSRNATGATGLLRLATGTDSSFLQAGGSGKMEITGNTINLNSSVKFLSFTTAQRDGLTPANGFFIYNSSTNKFQGYANGAWVDLH